jgi:ATP-dependent Lon protease
VHPARTYLPRFQAPSCFVIQRLGFNSTCVALARKKSEEPAGEGGEEGEWPQEPIQSTTKRRTSVKVIRSVNTARSDSLASESSTRKKKASTSASGGAAASSGSAAPPARHEDLIPSDSFIVTIQRRPLMPGTGVPMTLSDTSLFSALEKMKAQNDPRHKYMTLVWVPGLEDGELNSDPTKLPPNPIGTLCLIVKSNYANASNQSYLLHGLKRVRIGKRLSAGPFRAQITELVDAPYNLDNPRIKAYVNELAAIAKKVIGNGELRDHFDLIMREMEYRKPPQVSFLWAAVVQHSEPKLLQEVLECVDVEQRLLRVLNLMKNDLDVQSVQEDIKKEIHRKMQTAQKQSLLQEQLKAIKKELGLDGDAREADIAEFNQRLQSRVLSKEGSKVRLLFMLMQQIYFLCDHRLYKLR